MKVTKGPNASGAVFGFRYGTPKDKDGKGGSARFEAGDKPVTVPKEAESAVKGYCQAGYLNEFTGDTPKASTAAAKADE